MSSRLRKRREAIEAKYCQSGFGKDVLEDMQRIAKERLLQQHGSPMTSKEHREFMERRNATI